VYSAIKYISLKERKESKFSTQIQLLNHEGSFILWPKKKEIKPKLKVFKNKFNEKIFFWNIGK
jgi:hypothetical protein